MQARRAGPRSASRRDLLKLGLAASVMSGSAFADEYPSRPITIVAGFIPGGSIDFGARLIAKGLTDVLGATAIVENRPGATGIIASEHVAHAKADGYTLLVGTATPIVIAPQAMKRPSFNALVDLKAVNMIVETPMSLAVSPRLGVRSLKELVDLSRKRPVTVGTSGLGGVLHLLIEQIKQATGANFQVIPYKGSGTTIVDTIAGHIDANMSDVGSFIPMQKTGKLVILGITSEKRLPSLPDVPTFQEDVPGLVLISWTGLFAPAKTPKPIVEKLSSAMMQMAKLDDIRDHFITAGGNVQVLSSPEAFEAIVARDYERFGKQIKELGLDVN